MKWNISKEFDFCYGHRVWSQNLNAKFSLDEKLVCRHLHGHQGKIKIYLEANKLKNSMITDFKHLNWFKKFVDDNIDHKFILDINDPLFSNLLKDFYENDKIINLIKMNENYFIPNIKTLDNPSTALVELYESYILVDFVPTSENISSWIHSIVQEKMRELDVIVSKVQFFETPKTCSEFSI